MKGSLALHGTDVRSPPPSNLTLPRSPAGTNNKRMLELICLLVQARTARLGRARGASSDLLGLSKSKELSLKTKCFIGSSVLTSYPIDLSAGIGMLDLLSKPPRSANSLLG